MLREESFVLDVGWDGVKFRAKIPLMWEDGITYETSENPIVDLRHVDAANHLIYYLREDVYDWLASQGYYNGEIIPTEIFRIQFVRGPPLTPLTPGDFGADEDADENRFGGALAVVGEGIYAHVSTLDNDDHYEYALNYNLSQGESGQEDIWPYSLYPSKAGASQAYFASDGHGTVYMAKEEYDQMRVFGPDKKVRIPIKIGDAQLGPDGTKRIRGLAMVDGQLAVAIVDTDLAAEQGQVLIGDPSQGQGIFSPSMTLTSDDFPEEIPLNDIQDLAEFEGILYIISKEKNFNEILRYNYRDKSAVFLPLFQAYFLETQSQTFRPHRLDHSIESMSGNAATSN